MKNIQILFASLIFSVAVNAQTKDACFYLHKATDAYCAQKYKKVIRPLNDFIEKYPSHPLEEEAMFMKAYSCYLSGNKKVAVELFQEFLKRDNYNESDSFGINFFDCQLIAENCRNLLIPNMLVSMQHEAAILLFEQKLDEKNWGQAAYYLQEASDRYRLWYGCGTGDYDEDMRLASLSSKYYLAFGNKDSALRVLLPFTLEAAAFPSQYYKPLMEQAISLLKDIYGPVELKIMFERALSSIYYNSYDGHHSTESRIYYLRLIDVDIKVSPNYLFEHNINEQEVKDYVRATEFFKSILEETE